MAEPARTAQTHRSARWLLATDAVTSLDQETTAQAGRSPLIQRLGEPTPLPLSLVGRTGDQSRVRIVHELQRVHGNAVVQREILDWLRNLWRGLTGTPGDQERVEGFVAKLRQASHLCSLAAQVFMHPAHQSRLRTAAERFSRIVDLVSRGLELRGAAQDVTAFIDAVNALQPIDLRHDQDRAARAFGQLFAAAGRLGQRLREGPWTPYFQFLGGMEEFFTHMRAALDPSVRWRRQFEELEREAR
ncbi:MAG: hypothetical protein C4345_10865 [Chloroflexota bacterium]